MPTDLQWTDAGRALLFSAGVKGENQVFRVDVAAHEWQLYWFDEYLEGKSGLVAPDWR